MKMEPRSSAFIDVDALVERSMTDVRVRERLPGGGVVNIDRRLPFLLVYREPRDRSDAGTARLLTGESSYLLARSGDVEAAAEIAHRLARAGSASLGAFLVLEVWTPEDPESREFTVHAPDGPAPETLRALTAELAELDDLLPGVSVRVDHTDVRRPPGLPALLTVEESWQGEILFIGLEVPSVFRDPDTGGVYPPFLRRFRTRLSRALRKAVHEFVRVQTSVKVVNHLALGTRTLPDAVWEVDRELYDIERSFDLLLLTTPANLDEAWEDFRASGYSTTPRLHFRLLSIDPDLLKRRLFAIEMEHIDDPALAELYQDKRRELDTRLTMLTERGTDSFRYSSMRLYGRVDDRLLGTALDLLRRVEKPRRWEGEWVTATAFRKAAREELEHYSSDFPGLQNRVQIRRDLAGLMVSEGVLLIGSGLKIKPERLAPLIHHEVGTHVLTYVNGSAQPLKQLSLGLADYDELQEGLAVLAEYLAGGLDRLRMRTLAARVVAARSVEDGADFVETFRLLRTDFNYSESGAWHIALRVHACGGFTRDLIYLRGLVDLVDLLRSGGSLEHLYVGKIAQKHIPIIDELRSRGILKDPPLVPRVLQSAAASERLAAVRAGITLTEMICQESG